MDSQKMFEDLMTEQVQLENLQQMQTFLHIMRLPLL
jgi:hypothetical protein